LLSIRMCKFISARACHDEQIRAHNTKWGRNDGKLYNILRYRTVTPIQAERKVTSL